MTALAGPIKPDPGVSASSSATAPRALARPKIKRDPDDYGPTVPLAPDSDDDFNPAPAGSRPPRKRADASPAAASTLGGRKKARSSVALKVEPRRLRSSSPKKRNAAAAQPDGSKRFRFGVDSSDDDDEQPGPSTRRSVATNKVKVAAAANDDDDDDDSDDFDRAARKKRPAKRLHMRTAVKREAANPLRLLAGKSPLSDSDDALEAVAETRAVIGAGGILRRIKIDRPPPASAKGKEREVIELDGSDTEDDSVTGVEPSAPAPPMDVDDDSSGSSCSSDEDLDFALKLEHRLTEKALHGRILGHRERRKLRRQIARVVPTIVKVEAEAQPAVAMDVDGSATEDEDSDDGEKTLEEMAAKVKRLREIRAQEDALAQPALAAAGPIVPPPLPAPPALGSVADAAVAGAEPSVSNPSAFDAVIEPPSLPQIEHKPAFDPPVAQQALGPLVLEANADGTGLPPTFVNRHINCQLREYQRDGVRFLWSRYRDGKGGILGDDMGLGKTIQVIAFLSAIMGFSGERPTDHNRKVRCSNAQLAVGRMKKGIHLDNPRPNEEWPTALIIAPSSVCENWVRELETWGYFSVGYYIGVPRERGKIMAEYKQGWYDIMIMSLDTARNSIADYADEHFSVVFVDEVHKVKNPRAQLTKALKKLEHPIRFGLTGTAIQNRFEEFWCILDWARPGEIGNKDDWDSFVTKPIKNGQSHDATVEQVLQGRVRASQLVTKILPHFFLRRTKALIAHQMPRKVDKVVLCALTPRQYDCLQRLRATPEVQKMIHNSAGQGPLPAHLQAVDVRAEMFRFITMFKKVANHLALILPQPEDDLFTQRVARYTFQTIYPEVAVDDLVAPELLESRRDLCGKWEALNQLLDLWRPYTDSTENKVLIFSTSVRLLKIIAGFLTQEGREFLFLHGGVPTGDRMPMIDKFQTDPNVYVFLISTLVGGVGLNLTAANKVVIFDPSWNPSNDLQAMDRAFRIGQKSDVEVYRLVAAGSIEENIYTRQLYKQQMSSIGYDGKFEKRMFDGIIDERGQKGELFGLSNLFELKEDAIKTESILDRIRDAELPFADPVTDDFDDEKEATKKQDKDELDIGSLFAGSDDKASQDEDITELLSHAGAAYISSDKDLLGQEERERRIFDECRRYRREHPNEAKNTKAFSLKRQKAEGEPAAKKSAVKEKDAKPLFAPPVRIKKGGG